MIMGIEKFFSSIKENKITNEINQFADILETKLSTKHLLIDFNSIIYLVKFKVLHDINNTLYDIILNRFNFSKSLLKNYDFEDNQVFKNISPKQYHEFFTNQLLEKMIIDNVIKYIQNILTNYIKSDVLELFYIAIDGTPSKAKMMEQKKRRYIGAFINLMKNEIYEKHKKEIKTNKQRYDYEIYKIDWGTFNITPGTDFMHNLDLHLSSSDFELTVREICKNIKTYIYSGPYVLGEGEYKICEYLKSSDITSNCVIYSPDSDVTLLGLLLNSVAKITNIKILRQNQQKKVYDVINIDILANNIFNYVENKTNKSNKNNIINDIVFALTIFGNDFVPKNNAFNVVYDFDKIINKYIEVIKNSDYLIKYDNRYKIDNKVFFELIRRLKNDEGGNLQKVYLSNYYKNYDKLKRVLGATHNNFTNILNEFLIKLRIFNKNVKKNIKDKNIDNEFLDVLKLLTKFKNEKSNEKFLDEYYGYYKNTHTLPHVYIKLQPYKYSLTENHYNEKFMKQHTRFPVIEYDKEIFMFDNMLDEYRNILHAEMIDMGHISVDIKTYNFKADNIVDGVKKYYNDFFGIKDFDVKNQDMKDVIESYLDGLMWTFEYYYNGSSESIDKPSLWYYKYSHAPLLTQMYYYLKYVNIDYFTTSIKKINKMQINDESKYFNSLEHLMYVTPNTMLLECAPPEYFKFTENKKYYSDMNEYINNLKNDNLKIDCRGAIYLQKCHIDLKEINDAQFITDLRKINLPVFYKKRTTIQHNIHHTDYLKLTTLDNLCKVVS